MNRSDALNILELNPSSTEDDIKKRYREFAKKYHPDLAKDQGSTDKFKLINQAYDVLKQPEPSPVNVGAWNPGSPDFAAAFRDMIGFQNFSRQQRRIQETIYLPVTLTFEESIFGCDKECKYEKQVQCDDCTGKGRTVDSQKKCHACTGTGYKVRRGQNVMVSEVCNVCMGSGAAVQICKTCSGAGSNQAKINITISIPKGVTADTKVRVPGAGHFIYDEMFMQPRYLDAMLQITVIPHERFRREGMDVVSDVTISLKDAIIGTTLQQPTLYGTVDLVVPKLSRHRDELIELGAGVRLDALNGHHKFRLNVTYPENIDPLVQTLSQD